MGESQVLREVVEGQEGKSNATAIDDDSCNFGNIARKRRRSVDGKGKGKVPANQEDFTAPVVVKRGRKDKKKEKRVLLERTTSGEKENDSVSLGGSEGTMAPAESSGDGTVFDELLLSEIEKNGVGQSQEKAEGVLLGNVFNNNSNKGEESSSRCNGGDFTAASVGKGKLEGLLVQTARKYKRKKRGKGKGMYFDAEEENVESVKDNVVEEEENLMSEGDGIMGCEENHVKTVKEEAEIRVSEGDGKTGCEENHVKAVREEVENPVSAEEGKMGSEEIGHVQEEERDLAEENRENHVKIFKEEVEIPVSEGDGKTGCEENHVMAVTEEVKNPVSEGEGKMDSEEIGQVQEEEMHLWEENREGSGDAGCGALKKRESSRRALQKMEELKQEWVEWSEEEKQGRRKNKRGRKSKKSRGDSVVARKKRSLKASENAEEEDQKVSGSDGESMVDEEKKQVETKKKRRGRRPTKGDNEEDEQKLEGSNLSRLERYSLRTKKLETDNAPKVNKRCRDENVRYLDLLKLALGF